MKNSKDLIYSITCLSFTIILGAGIYEHLSLVPQWSSAPPESLAMFQGEYGLDPSAFWTKIHPVTMLLFIITLITSWRSERRINVLIAFGGYFIVMIITFIYYVPELIDITSTEYSTTINEELTNRANLWEILSLLRLLVIIGLAVTLFLGLTKPNKIVALPQP